MNKILVDGVISINEMNVWFENCLYPQMLQCESSVKQMVKKNLSHSSENSFNNCYDSCTKDTLTPSFKDGFAFDAARFKDTNSFDTPSFEDSNSLDADEAEQLQLFLQKSAAHQHEMQKIRRDRQENEILYIPDTHGPVFNDSPSVDAPSLHNSRFDNLSLLYGFQASSIVSLETILQARFDQTVDFKQPAYWPVIPLKFE